MCSLCIIYLFGYYIIVYIFHFINRFICVYHRITLSDFTLPLLSNEKDLTEALYLSLLAVFAGRRLLSHDLPFSVAFGTALFQ